VSVKVKGGFTVTQPAKTDGFVSFRINNALLPKYLQRSYEAREFTSPVLRVTPIQVRTQKGEDTIIRVAMRAEAAYGLRKEADMVYLEFTHPTDFAVETAASVAKAAPAAQPAAAEVAVEQQLVQSQSANGKRTYVGRKVTLEFADAEVRKIFQLLSEVSNKNFVLGDEVTGAISLKLVNVPWDQALDIILDTKGLDKREEGNIILIRGKGKFKSLLDEEQEIRKAALKSEPLETAMYDVNYADLATITGQFGALKTDRGTITQDSRTNKIIVKDVKSAIDDMKILLKNLDVPERQVMIEARIVEASASFTRSLGVNWGIHYRDGSASIAGINSIDTSFGGLASNVSPSSGVSGQPGASAGISFGTLASNIKLDMRLNAAVTAGLVRIVSTPRVATLNHKSAKITQGQQIPYTSSTSDKVETKFIEAALSLEVTPHINPNGTIVLKIDAKNDSPGSGGSPPPINKKQATTEMMLKDGETTVIGGIFVDRETNSDEGVPFLKDVPFLGGLFKSDSVEKSRSELLIFITPRILLGSN
jgi:type IV pilus assembly protein PilQ